MRARYALFCAVAAALAVPPVTASAAPVCNLVSDTKSDGNYPFVPVANIASIDVHSVDVATGKKNLAVVLRLGAGDGRSDPANTLGATWDVSFNVGDLAYAISRRMGNSQGGHQYTDEFKVNGKVMPPSRPAISGNTLTWTFPRSRFAPLSKKNAMITKLFAITTTNTGAHDYAPNGGAPSETMMYKDRAPSCVRVS